MIRRVTTLLLLVLLPVACGGSGGSGSSSSAGGQNPAKPPADPPVDPPPLTWHEGAAEVAYLHSVDMDVRDFFDHTNPDGELPWDRLNDAGIAWSTAGENIAHGYSSPTSVMTAWMNSSGHRASILRDGFTHIGIGVHDNGLTIWWTQVTLVPR